GRTLNVAGTVNWTDAGNLNLANDALISVQPGGTFNIQNNASVTGSGFFSNAGTLTRDVATGTATFAAGVAFNTAGTVNVLRGTLNVAGGYTQTAGLTTISMGATLASAGGVNIQGGTLAGSGTINGNVINSGQVNPGSSPGILTINGNYTQTASG